MPTADSLATWSRTPLAPDPALAQQALEQGACRGEGPVAPQVVLQDRRTASTAAFFLSGPGHWGSCLISVGASGGSWTNVIPTLFGPISVEEDGNGTVGSDHAFTLGGLLSPEVGSVQIDRDDGAVVDASVGNGLWLARWPGAATAVKVTALDGAGLPIAVLTRTHLGWDVQGAAP